MLPKRALTLNQSCFEKTPPDAAVCRHATPCGEDASLSVEHLSVSYGRRRVLDDVSLVVRRREIVGIVGESGSGKTTLLRSIMHLLPPSAFIESGSISFNDTDLLACSRKDMMNIRGGEISYLFQNSALSFDPQFSVGKQFDEVMRAHGLVPDRAIQIDKLAYLGFDDPAQVLDLFPFQLSGGMAQRVALAFALITQPCVLLADEPTSSLDKQACKDVMRLLENAVSEQNLALVFVSHDINLVAQLANRILVMHKGKVIEEGLSAELIAHPRQPYTKELIAAVPPEVAEGSVKVCSLR